MIEMYRKYVTHEYCMWKTHLICGQTGCTKLPRTDVLFSHPDVGSIMFRCEDVHLHSEDYHV